MKELIKFTVVIVISLLVSCVSESQVKKDEPADYVCDSLKHGAAKSYSQKDNVQIIENFYYGSKSGIYEEYFENGQLKVITNFYNDKMDGVYKEYYDDGTLKRECIYYSGQLVGEDYQYYDNGSLKEFTIRHHNPDNFVYAKYNLEGEVTESESSGFFSTDDLDKINYRVISIINKQDIIKKGATHEISIILSGKDIQKADLLLGSVDSLFNTLEKVEQQLEFNDNRIDYILSTSESGEKILTGLVKVKDSQGKEISYNFEYNYTVLDNPCEYLKNK